MNDSLTIVERDAAQKQGWQLADVFDLKTRLWRIEIIPAEPSAFNGAQQAQRFVINAAKEHSALALRALQIVARSHQPRKKK